MCARYNSGVSNLSGDPSTLPETADPDLGKAPNTVKAYRSDWATFEVFCRDRKLVSLPATPLTVVQYLDDASRRLKTHTILFSNCGGKTGTSTVRLSPETY